MSRGHGEWLRVQRQAKGWSVQQMVRELRDAAGRAGDTLPDRSTLIVMIHRWENDRSGIGERYRRHYCNAFQIPLDRFGGSDLPDVPHASGAAGLADCPRLYFWLGYVSALLTGQAVTPVICRQAGTMCPVPRPAGDGR